MPHIRIPHTTTTLSPIWRRVISCLNVRVMQTPPTLKTGFPSYRKTNSIIIDWRRKSPSVWFCSTQILNRATTTFPRKASHPHGVNNNEYMAPIFGTMVVTNPSPGALSLSELRWRIEKAVCTLLVVEYYKFAPRCQEFPPVVLVRLVFPLSSMHNVKKIPTSL